ncbi:hypothetical protein [Granulicella sp. dw_53]|uniref:hypothetical protein n=1 Tax=Granulicella sp. dw_53 TaxID=2719792 RepID=UPI001BD2AEF7|nr:hypothetical protein [Granulicella sp. dw_53]
MLPVSPQTIRGASLVAVIILLYAGRLTKGSAKETPDGLVFGMKPLVLWTRIIAIPLYFAIIVYPLVMQHRQVPVWLPIVLLLAAALTAYQLPGTILLTPTAVVQRFWLRADKTIQYHEVMAIQSIQAGRITRVLGDNRTTVLHNTAHSDAERFRAELERRTNKRVTI